MVVLSRERERLVYDRLLFDNGGGVMDRDLNADAVCCSLNELVWLYMVCALKAIDEEGWVLAGCDGK